jgi:hypothetical protein
MASLTELIASSRNPRPTLAVVEPVFSVPYVRRRSGRLHQMKNGSFLRKEQLRAFAYMQPR